MQQMSQAQADAVGCAFAQEALDSSFQFRENAAMKNGLPTQPVRNVVQLVPQPVASPAPAGATETDSSNSQNLTTAQAVQELQDLIPWLENQGYNLPKSQTPLPS